MIIAPEAYTAPEQKLGAVEAIVRQYPQVAGLQAYEYFRNPGVAQRDAFINGDIDTLDFTYPSLTAEAINGLRVPMERALSAVTFGPQTEKTRALMGTLEYRYTELSMLDAARVMNSTGVSQQEKREAVEWFKLANESLFGKPDPAMFHAVAAGFLTPYRMPVRGDARPLATLRGELRDLTGPIPEPDRPLSMPSPQLVRRIGALTRARFDGIVRHIDPERIYDRDGIVESLGTTLQELGATALGWEVVVVENSSVLSVSAAERQIQVGKNKQPVTGRELRGTTVHEAGDHAGRSITAASAGWLSAAYGQDGYLMFEEPFGSALQHAYNDTVTVQGESYFMIAGLAYGLDDHDPRAIRKTYEVMWRTYALQRVENGELQPAALLAAKRDAFARVKRMFRGTDGRQPGVVDLRDTTYRVGQERVWRALKHVRTQADFDPFFVGKLDNTIPEHQTIAARIMADGGVPYNSAVA